MLFMISKTAEVEPAFWLSAIIAGWAVGAATEISEAAITVLFAFLAGGVIFNVLKEELPERKSRFWAFAVGVGVYSALLLTL